MEQIIEIRKALDDFLCQKTPGPKRYNKAIEEFIVLLMEYPQLADLSIVLKRVFNLEPLSRLHFSVFMETLELYLDLLVKNCCMTKVAGILCKEISDSTCRTIKAQCLAMDLLMISGGVISDVKSYYCPIYQAIVAFIKDAYSFDDISFYVKSITAHLIWLLSFPVNGKAFDMSLINDSSRRKVLRLMMGWTDLK